MLNLHNIEYYLFVLIDLIICKIEIHYGVFA
jgi:hypothetical protein